jgi:uncharacterized membrane protein
MERPSARRFNRLHDQNHVPDRPGVERRRGGGRHPTGPPRTDPAQRAEDAAAPDGGGDPRRPRRAEDPVSAALYGAALAAALACGLSAGVVFAFSAFVMPALDRLDPGASIAAMQAINVKAVTPPFMIVLLGGAVLCVVLLVATLRSWGDATSPWLAAGAVVYLVGVIGLTVGHHVPLNDALATVDAHAADAAARWDDYRSSWTSMNHVRAAAGTVATGLLIVGLAAG